MRRTPFDALTRGQPRAVSLVSVAAALRQAKRTTSPRRRCSIVALVALAFGTLSRNVNEGAARQKAISY
jgi:hypothetical protein